MTPFLCREHLVHQVPPECRENKVNPDHLESGGHRGYQELTAAEDPWDHEEKMVFPENLVSQVSLENRVLPEVQEQMANQALMDEWGRLDQKEIKANRVSPELMVNLARRE